MSRYSYNPVPLLHAMNIPDAKAAAGKEEEKMKEVASMGGEEKSTGDRAGTTRSPNSSFSTLMDMCYLKNSALGPNFQKCKGCCCAETRCCEGRFRLVCSVPEQGSSASQMTAATVLHAIFGLPGCSGQASDAVSAYTQVKLEYAPKHLNFWFRNATHCGFVCLRPDGPKQDKNSRSRGAA